MKSLKKQNRLRSALKPVIHEMLEDRRLMAATIIMDNTAAGVVQTGAWSYKTGITGAYNSDYLHDQGTGKGSKAVTYTPTIATAGQYQVYAWWQAQSIRPTNVPYIVTSTAGTTTIAENQQINGGQWNLLGTYNFNAGTAGSVKISNTGTAANTWVTADAVEFVPVTTTTTTTVSMVSPASGSTFTAGANISVSAKVVAGTGTTISKVDFFQGSTNIGTATAVDGNGNYTITWSAVPTGNYSITATATDNTSATFTSSAVSITVNPVSSGETPYPGPNPAALPGTIQAENFDNGGEGLAYHDSTSSNLGGASYRSPESVDVQTETDGGAGYSIGHITAGEYLKYTATVGATGQYTFSTRVSADVGYGGTFHYSVDGTNVTGALTLPSTGGWTTYQTLTSPAVTLTAGQHVFQLMFDTANSGGDIANVNWFSVNSVATQQPTVAVTSPTNNATFNTGTSISLAVSAVDGSGTISKIDYFAKLGATNTLVATATTAGAGSNWAASWTPSTAGSYAITAVLTDNNTTVTSAAVNITVATVGAEQPFGGTPWSIYGRIQAEDFDTGGEGIAYHDTTTGNSGGQYRTTENVDISTTNDTGGAYDVTMMAGEWLKYTVNVGKSGFYDFVERTSGFGMAGGTFHIEVDGVNVTGAVSVGTNSNIASYGYPNPTPVQMTAGQHVIRFVADTTKTAGSPVMKFNYLKFHYRDTAPTAVLTAPTSAGSTFAANSNITVSATAADVDGVITRVEFYQGNTLIGTSTTPVSGKYSITWNAVPTGNYNLTAVAYDDFGAPGMSTAVSITVGTPAGESPFFGTAMTVPGIIQAENFDNGGEGIAYHDTDTGNSTGAYRTNVNVDIEPSTDNDIGFELGHIMPGEYLNYTVNVTANATYTFSSRWSSTTGGTFHIEVDGVNKSGTLTIPNTGNYSTWADVNSSIALTTGTHVIRIVAESSKVSGQGLGKFNDFKVIQQTFTWTQKANAPFAREESEGATVGGKLYVFSGLQAQSGSGVYLANTRIDVYDPSTNLWSTKKAMPEALTHSATIVDGTIVWFIGGYLGNHPADATAHVWKYDTVADTWTRSTDLPMPRGAGGAGLIGRTIYYSAGMNVSRTGEQASTWALNIDDANPVWVQKASMPNPRNHVGYAVLAGKLYIIGGQNGEEDEPAIDTDEVDIYDPSTDTWSLGPKLPIPSSHYHNSEFVYNGKLYTVGGEDPHNNALADVWQFDPATGQWTPQIPLPSPRRAMVSGIINGQIVATGGFLLSGNQQVTTWVSSPLP